MDKEFWHRKWQSKDIGFNQLQPNKIMQDYFSVLELKPGSRVFVPLCGQSIDMIWLAEKGYQVTGAELSTIACQAFFEENNLPVTITKGNDFIVYESDGITILCGDFFKLNHAILGEIEAVYDRAALIALPTDLRKSYANYLINLIMPTAAIFLITMSYNQNKMQGPPFSVDEKEVETLYSAYFKIDQLYNQHIEALSHLKGRGLMQITEQAFSLIRKN